MPNAPRERVKETVLQAAPDVLFFGALLVLRAFSKGLNLLVGGLHPLSYLGLACFFTWVAWHYIGGLSMEFETYKRPDATRAERVAAKIFETFLLLFGLFAVGQGFFVFQIMQPILGPAGLQGGAGIVRAASFLFPAVSALAGWMERKTRADGRGMLDWLWVLALTLTVPYMFMPFKPLFILGHAGNGILGFADIALDVALRLLVGLGIPLGLRAGLRLVATRIARFLGKKGKRTLASKKSPWLDMLYPLFVSLVLYFWLRALLDLYIPASLAYEALFKIEVAMLGVLAFGPIPIRLVMALRPPLRISHALVSLSLVAWLVLDVWGAVSARQHAWLSEPINETRLAALPCRLPYTDDFVEYNQDFWLYYNGSSESFEAPLRPTREGSLVLEPETMRFYMSPYFAMPADGTIQISRRIMLDTRLGNSFFAKLELYVSDSERIKPGISAELIPSLSIQVDCMSGALVGSDGALVFIAGAGGKSERLVNGVPLSRMVEESLLWDTKTGNGEYRLDGHVYPFSLEPTEGKVFCVLMRARGDGGNRLYIDSMQFGQ